MNQTTIAMIVIIGLIILLAIYLYLRHAKTAPKAITKSGIDLEALFSSLGAKENIQAVSANGSKITFILKDSHLVNAEGLKALGASGIVAGKDKLTVIFGRASEVLAKEIGALL